MKDTYDIIIVGGGVMGCAAAYYLSREDKSLNIAVIEKDPTYEYASSALSMANIRIQFSMEENIRISLYGSETFETFDQDMTVDGIAPGIDFKREGNLFTVTNENRLTAQQAMELQTRTGAQVEWWSNARIKEHYPLYEPGNLAGASFGPRDGHLDAYSMLMGYKTKARAQGVRFIADEVTSITTSPTTITGVTLAERGHFQAATVINCAGAWAADLAATAGVQLPVKPVKRQVFALDTEIKPHVPLPLTFLPSGLYFRTDTGNCILAGKSMDSDPTGFDFTWDSQRFVDHLWPELAAFVPAFDRLKILRGWAGLYAENTFDGNAILGEWPQCKGLFLANGFSGHGLQQAPAVGRYLSELILHKEPVLDLSIFKPQRILDNQPLSENGLV